ncbi:MAG: TetR/AcrR family transcriptional regulator, partial [Dermatophilaceae bacterium]
SAAGRPTLRQRRRTELVEQIVESALRHLASDGAAGLSLRAVARDIEIAPSALYRYFASRDELLTELIARTYTTIAAVLDTAADEALAAHPRDPTAAWVSVTVTYRTWARAHLTEFALVYGSPVPGYHAPEETTRRLGQSAGDGLNRIASAAAELGLIDSDEMQRRDAELTASARRELAEVAAARGLVGPYAAGELVARLGCWTSLQGLVGMELFGHLPPLGPDAADALFRQQSAAIVRTLVRSTT